MEKFELEQAAEAFAKANNYWGDKATFDQTVETFKAGATWAESQSGWIKIEPNHLPQGEVLAGNFRQGTYGFKEKLIGYVCLVHHSEIVCEAGSEVLENVTHFIDIHKEDPEVDEPPVFGRAL